MGDLYPSWPKFAVNLHWLGERLAEERLVGAAGIEPATLGLEIRCSIRLSYAPTMTRDYCINVVVGGHSRTP